MFKAEIGLRFHQPHRGAAVKARAPMLYAINFPAVFKMKLQSIGKLYVPAARLGLLGVEQADSVKNGRREDISAHNRKVGGRLLSRWLLYDIKNIKKAARAVFKSIGPLFCLY